MEASCRVYLVTNRTGCLRDVNDDNDDDQIRKKVTFTYLPINVHFCAVRQITRMLFSC
jgi:hypothetical protein